MNKTEKLKEKQYAEVKGEPAKLVYYHLDKDILNAINWLKSQEIFVSFSSSYICDICKQRIRIVYKIKNKDICDHCALDLAFEDVIKNNKILNEEL